MSKPDSAADVNDPASPDRSPLEAAREFLSRLIGVRRILIAISGGSDSTGLLVALSRAAQDGYPEIKLVAATVDHALRPESANEAAIVHAFCESRGVEHMTCRWEGEKPRTGLMAAARLARYQLLKDAALRFDCDAIVTGHTLDDQFETVAMRKARSDEEGGRGLAGMAEATLFEGDIWILRPFLGVRREVIRSRLCADGVSWIDDPSNDNPRFERVRVRGRVADDINRAEIARAGEIRQSLARSAAGVIERVAQNPIPGYFTFQADACENDAGWLALTTLLAVAGGQSFLPGSEQVEFLREALSGGSNFRLTLSRCVVERRGAVLHIVREKRNLPQLTIAEGQRCFWDGRFEIRNNSDVALAVSAGQGLSGFDDELIAGTPARVAALTGDTLPRVEGDDEDRWQMVPYLAPFENFLSGFDFALADAVARLVNRADFPRQILHPVAKK